MGGNSASEGRAIFGAKVVLLVSLSAQPADGHARTMAKKRSRHANGPNAMLSVCFQQRSLFAVELSRGFIFITIVEA